jgi:hypothetical protein
MVKAITAVQEKGMGYLKVTKTFNVPDQTFCLINKGDLDLQKAVSTMLGQKAVSRELKSQ